MDSQKAISGPEKTGYLGKYGYMAKNGVRSFRCWYLPYIKSRLYGDFRPLLSYLFTEWKCNMNCHYCYSWNNRVPGMPLEVAKSAIDWLKTVGCRVVALMGGEPLLRKEFILDVVRYGSGKGFFIYLPTNGLLLDEDFINRVGEAGVAAINLAVDKIEPACGLPKSFKRIEPQFKALVRKRNRYGYVLFFNINITSGNMEDVKALTEIARDNNIGMDYHINEIPVIDQPHYAFKEKGLWIEENDFSRVDSLIDWLVDKNRAGYPMVNSVEHLLAMKDFIRGKHRNWICRAGQNSLFIRADGTLAPCFELNTIGSTGRDWGRIHAPGFTRDALKEQKAECNSRCLSTCNFQVSHYYDSLSNGLRWVYKHLHRNYF